MGLNQLREHIANLNGPVDAATAAGIANSLSPWATDSQEWALLVDALRGSIDSALALVATLLPGWHWHVHDGGVAMLCRDWSDDYAPVYRSPSIRPKQAPFEKWQAEVPLTPPLAILASLLSALIAEQGQSPAERT